MNQNPMTNELLFQHSQTEFLRQAAAALERDDYPRIKGTDGCFLLWVCMNKKKWPSKKLAKKIRDARIVFVITPVCLFKKIVWAFGGKISCARQGKWENPEAYSHAWELWLMWSRHHSVQQPDGRTWKELENNKNRNDNNSFHAKIHERKGNPLRWQLRWCCRPLVMMAWRKEGQCLHTWTKTRGAAMQQRAWQKWLGQ